MLYKVFLCSSKRIGECTALVILRIIKHNLITIKKIIKKFFTCFHLRSPGLNHSIYL